MFRRLPNLSKTSSFILLGPRGSGKTQLVKSEFIDPNPAQSEYIDLLLPEVFDELVLNPTSLIDRLKALPTQKEWIIIDEVQKIPRLLDVVHHQIENTDRKFILTGSSARKLKRGGANLLAGRAFLYNLYPFSSRELEKSFNLDKALRWGMLPKIWQDITDEDRELYLQSYGRAYLQEEIISEQVVRKLDPFRKFLPIAAQTSGAIINAANIARDIGASDKTILAYFQILEETLIGFFLEPYHASIRKRQRTSPKFYLFDTGIERSLMRLTTQPLVPGTYAYGRLFENFIINEAVKRNEYTRTNYLFSYLRTKDDAEIDLVVERPGLPHALIEIKSSTRIDQDDVGTIQKLGRDFPNAEAFCFSLDKTSKMLGNVKCLHWEFGFSEIGL